MTEVLKQKIFDYLDKHEAITITECCDIFDAEPEDVINAVFELIEEGRVKEVNLGLMQIEKEQDAA